MSTATDIFSLTISNSCTILIDSIFTNSDSSFNSFSISAFSESNSVYLKKFTPDQISHL